MKLLLLLTMILFPEQEKILDHTSDFISSDQLGNFYCVENFTLLKFNADGKKLAGYSNSYLGNISQIDALDPLRILVFYKDFNQILFLDKNLAELGDPIDLYQFSPNETTLMCSSRHGGFWIFNPIDMQAFRISPQGVPVTKTILLHPFLEKSYPSALVEKNDQLFFLLPEKGVLVLTDQGQYHKMIRIPGIEAFQIRNKNILYVKDRRLYIFSPESQEDPELFPGKSFPGSKYRIEKNRLYHSDGIKLYIYPVKQSPLKQ